MWEQPGSLCPAQCSLWCDNPEGCSVTLILGLGAVAENGAESPCAWHGFSKAYCHPGSIHTNPGQSDITVCSCPWPCSSGLTVLCLHQGTCCWATPGAPAPGRVALSTQELLLITSLQELPLPSLLLCRSASWSSVITKWGHVFTRAHMCIYFSLLPF